MIFHVRNGLHLGDCLWNLHWLRKCAAIMPEDSFFFYCLPEHHWQLTDLIETGDGIAILPLDESPDNAFNGWVNADGIWPQVGQPQDLIELVNQAHQNLAEKMGIVSPINDRESWLFDFPAFKREVKNTPEMSLVYRRLFIDCPSLSNAFSFWEQDMTWLREKLTGEGWLCLTNINPQIPIADIGFISTTSPSVMSIATGPMLATFNIWNKDTPRLILYKKNHWIDYGKGRDGYPHFDNLQSAYEYLKANGWAK